MKQAIVFMTILIAAFIALGSTAKADLTMLCHPSPHVSIATTSSWWTGLHGKPVAFRLHPKVLRGGSLAFPHWFSMLRPSVASSKFGDSRRTALRMPPAWRSRQTAWVSRLPSAMYGQLSIAHCLLQILQLTGTGEPRLAPEHFHWQVSAHLVPNVQREAADRIDAQFDRVTLRGGHLGHSSSRQWTLY